MNFALFVIFIAIIHESFGIHKEYERSLRKIHRYAERAADLTSPHKFQQKAVEELRGFQKFIALVDNGFNIRISS